MIQEQEVATSTGLHTTGNHTAQRTLVSRLLFSMLVGGIATVVLVLIVALLIYFVDPWHLSGSASNRFAALLALPVHSPQVLVAPGLFFIVTSIGTLLAAKPLQLAAYLRVVRAVQEETYRGYIALATPARLRVAVDAAVQDAVSSGASSVSVREEQISIVNLVQREDHHQFILSMPGVGKTTALRVYDYLAADSPFKRAVRRGRISVYIPMKNYSLYLKGQADSASSDARHQPDLLDFLYESDLPGMSHLRPYLQDLARQGRLLLLCDGLDEVDSTYVDQVSDELMSWMRTTHNRLVITCREVDYREHHDFVQLVNEGQASRAVIYPLQVEQVHEFVESYVERQDRHWRHTAGQVIQVIDRSRLRYHCANPMLLFTFMGIIDKIGIERGRQNDTRGRLLREAVKQLIADEQRQGRWSKGYPAESEVIRFLSELACAARWVNASCVIQLATASVSLEEGGNSATFMALADELHAWLEEHPAMGPFIAKNDTDASAQFYDDLAQIVEFVWRAGLIEISPGGVLSFRHRLIAEYFVAEAFYTAASNKQVTPTRIREALLENVGLWSEPVALWAGLADEPLGLAERFSTLGRNNPEYVLQALALAFICVGAAWNPPQADIQRVIVLPKSLEEALTIAVHNRAAREELARTFTQCAEEGAQEIYRSLLPLIAIDGIDDLLVLLDQSIVPDMLFNHLCDTVDNGAYETQVKRLTRVLGHFGGAIIDRATQCSLPLPEHSLRLRAAAVNILGGTGDMRAVEPVIARLHDADQFIVERAANSLIRLGPELALTYVLRELEDRSAKPFALRIHHAALTVLRQFIEERDVRHQVNLAQYLRILETIVPVLSTNYQAEPELQQLAGSILVRQARDTDGVGARDNRWEKVIVALLHYLPSQNDATARNVIRVFQEIGSIAIPSLLAQLNQSSEVVRIRIVEILQAIRDPRALSPLLRLVSDPSPAVQQQVASALRVYVPDSIPGLIDIVLESASEDIADRAAFILASIGEPVVEPIIAILFQIVPGRTRLLVSVLEHIRDLRALPALITLLQTPQMESLLVITIIRAISQFPDKRVVAPLITMLTDTNPQFYEEAIDALSRLGPLSLENLVAALDTPQPAHIRQRIRRAILGMMPFPGEALIAALEVSSDAQAQQILVVFKTQGSEAAYTLVRHLLHRDESVRKYVVEALSTMSGPIAVPALLDVLGQQETRRIVYAILLKYPDYAVLPLVDLLSEDDRGDAAMTILPQFGPAVLVPLVSGMNSPDNQARERTRRIVIELVRQSRERDDSADLQTVLRAIVGLFNPPLPAQARELLLSMLTEDLADVSIQALLEGLEDAYLIKDVSEAFVKLARRGLQDVVLNNLIAALHVEERRRGAATALAGLGEMAVLRVGELIASPQPPVAKAAQDVLRQIGAPALDFIWTAHSDKSNPQRRAAALAVFHSMRTEVIKDKLVALLTSNKPDEVAMAVALLLERIYDEATQHYADRVMIPELIEYMLTHTVESTNLRIIALLLLLVQYPQAERKKGETALIPVLTTHQHALYQGKAGMSGDFVPGESIIADHLVQALDDYPQHQRQLVYILLLLGAETEQLLLDVFNDPETRMELRAELAAILGMMSAPQAITEYAQNLSQYGLSANRGSSLFPEQLAIAQRALGGLLASGHWNVHRLQELRNASKEGSPARELFNVLLGWRYEVQLAQLRNELRGEREARKQEVTTLMMQAVSAQQRINLLENELQDVRREHSTKSDELYQTEKDRQQLRTNLDKVLEEKNAYSSSLNAVVNERDTLNVHLNQALQEKDAFQAQNAVLQAQIESLMQENRELYDQNQQLRQAQYHIP